MSGPPAGVATGGGPPSAAQIATMKEAGVKASFVDDMGMNMGSYVMGFVTDLILLGVLLAQVWHWYTWTKGERNFIRVIIYWVLFWCTFSSIFTMLWFNNLLVDNYGTYSQFVDNSWFQWLPFIGEGILLACQIFNLERAYRLHHRKIWVLLAIVPFMLVAAAGVIGIKIKTGGGTDFARGSYAIRPFMYLYLGGTLAVDIVITGIIAWGLWKSKTGWRHTDKMIMRIIMFSWESQVLPTLFAIVQLATFAHQPDNRIAFYFMISYAKVPAVSLMAVLNFRFSLRKDLTGAHTTNGLVGLDQNRYDPRDGGDHDQGFHAIRDDIPMVKYSPHANPTDWQPPQEK